MKKPLLVLSILWSLSASAEIKTETVEYKDGKTVLDGYVSYDDAVREKVPGVIVVHEWMGLGPYAKRRAEELARLGFVGFAINMYGKGVVAQNHEEAAKLAGTYRSDRKLMRRRAQAAHEHFKKHPKVNSKKIAAIGYCFGGTTVLEMARAGFDIRGVASFHGSLDTPKPEDTKKPKAKILVLHGAEDNFVNSQLPAFQEEMRKSGADWQMNVYGGAVHSFTVPEAGNDPSKGMAYHEQADRRSWEELKIFLAEVFR